MTIARRARGIVGSPFWYMFYGFWIAFLNTGNISDLARDRLFMCAFVLVPVLSIFEIVHCLRHRREAEG